MDAMTEAAMARLEAAVKDKPVGPPSISGVLAGDVILAAKLAKQPADGVVTSLMMGSAAASPLTEVFPMTEHVRHLIEQALAGSKVKKTDKAEKPEA